MLKSTDLPRIFQEIADLSFGGAADRVFQALVVGARVALNRLYDARNYERSDLIEQMLESLPGPPTPPPAEEVEAAPPPVPQPPDVVDDRPAEELL